MLSIFWCQQGDGDISGCKLLNTLVQSFVETCEKSSSSSNHYRIVESFTNVNVALLDAVYYHLVDTWPLQSDLIWAEKNLWSLEFLRPELNNLSIWQMVV